MKYFRKRGGGRGVNWISYLLFRNSSIFHHILGVNCTNIEFWVALVMIYAVLSNFDFAAKSTVKNLNKDFINAVRGGGVTVL